MINKIIPCTAQVLICLARALHIWRILNNAIKAAQVASHINKIANTYTHTSECLLREEVVFARWNMKYLDTILILLRAIALILKNVADKQLNFTTERRNVFPVSFFFFLLITRINSTCVAIEYQWSALPGHKSLSLRSENCLAYTL